MTKTVLHPFETYDQCTIAPGRSQLLIQMSYVGAAFYGVTPQPGLPTVAEAVQLEIQRHLGQPVKALTFTARTDKGVDAHVNFATGWLKDGPALPQAGITIQSTIQGLGPLHVLPVDPSVFARTIGLKKTYSYIFRDNFLEQDKSGMSYWDIHPPLEIEAMQEAAALFVGTHCFQSFQVRSGQEMRDTRCTIERSTVENVPKTNHREIKFTIQGNRFLRRMVRIMAGTLAEVGAGLMSPDAVYELLQSHSANLVGPTAPARGLTLEKITLVEDLSERLL